MTEGFWRKLLGRHRPDQRPAAAPTREVPRLEPSEPLKVRPVQVRASQEAPSPRAVLRRAGGRDAEAGADRTAGAHDPGLRVLHVPRHAGGAGRAGEAGLPAAAQAVRGARGGVDRGGPALGHHHRGGVRGQGAAALPGRDPALPAVLHRPAGRALRLGAGRAGGPPDLLDAEPWLEEHRTHSVTELEILHGVLRNPAMADHALFYFRDPAYVERLPAGRTPPTSPSESPDARAKLDRPQEPDPCRARRREPPLCAPRGLPDARGARRAGPTRLHGDHRGALPTGGDARSARPGGGAPRGLRAQPAPGVRGPRGPPAGAGHARRFVRRAAGRADRRARVREVHPAGRVGGALAAGLIRPTS